MSDIGETLLKDVTKEIMRAVTFFSTRNPGGTFWGCNLGLFAFGVGGLIAPEVSWMALIPCISGGIFVMNAGAAWSHFKGEPAVDESTAKALAMIDDFEKNGGHPDEACALRQKLAIALIESAGGEVRFIGAEEAGDEPEGPIPV